MSFNFRVYKKEKNWTDRGIDVPDIEYMYSNPLSSYLMLENGYYAVSSWKLLPDWSSLMCLVNIKT